MDRLEAMALFVRVAERGSFAAAAEQLGVARSVVTRQIAALEKHLGVKLMARSTRRLTLTTAGAAYLEQCRVILNLVEAAETDVAAHHLTPRGHLRLGLPLVFGLKRLSPLLLEFSQRYPAISLDMDYTDRQLNLIEEGFDLSIRITDRLEPGDIARKLGSCRVHTVASPDYLARHGRPNHPAELRHHECLAYTGDASNTTWWFQVEGRLQPVYVHSRFSANNGEALIDAAAAGLGIALQPDFIAESALTVGTVEAILEAFAPPALGIYALLPSNRYLPYRVRVLIDFLAERLRTADPGAG
ncbi:MAG TPA: LysR family transcriptional regulator [Candidatus Competibacteraceae bacterium]|nr:MAG: LysR family transcriptional regulator [Candidatus Competibacteraceae bacterium]HOB62749.1 LysR family transcriptional regulator [Candidatus Competibacteraceae bacterium]HQA26675.1 LysR family transcriptional regulator [Candidatus Competibacteraceae bacterium]HQD55897.1 LysR family transcriptional regulator [Candidatus Competibacteraceae bacterium]